jgi:hypothetical protein
MILKKLKKVIVFIGIISKRIILNTLRNPPIL